MNSQQSDPSRLTGAILAGGKARRMGGQDKGLISLAGKPMIEYVIAALQPQIDALLIVANRNRARYARYAPVVGDTLDGYQGPLAGMASALQAASTRWVLTVPCDVPLVPDNLVETMRAALQNDDEVCTVRCGERLQPVFTLMRTELLSSLLTFLNEGGRKIDRWLVKHRLAYAEFPEHYDAFENVNSKAELATMVERLQHR